MTLREQEFRQDDTTARLDRVEAYWRGLTRQGLAPPRAAIDPHEIGEALPFMFLLDAVAPGVGRLRIAGREICEIAGGEARGLPLSCLFAASARPRLAGLLKRAFEAHHPCRAPLIATRAARGRRCAELLLLPLLPRAGLPPQILGALSHDLRAGTHRFDFAGPVRIGAPPALRPALRLVRG
ncbi:PAS domain-containing protein [Limimaricola cinnabarinus]|uniref:PAS domain-containing protein n=1 Tax=Limimaricola cinnabarinus TaxID=1125964 RepID=UPI00249306EE|nr:PAS domain-containing protein [Limimaricola cinnabarinus]